MALSWASIPTPTVDSNPRRCDCNCFAPNIGEVIGTDDTPPAKAGRLKPKAHADADSWGVNKAGGFPRLVCLNATRAILCDYRIDTAWKHPPHRFRQIHVKRRWFMWLTHQFTYGFFLLSRSARLLVAADTVLG